MIRALLAPLAFVTMLVAFDAKDWQAVRDGVRGWFSSGSKAKGKSKKADRAKA